MSEVLFSYTESAVTVSDNTKKRRYEISVAGEAAGRMGYRVIGNRRVLMHTVIYEAFRGQGLSKIFIRGILDSLRIHGNTASNYCPAVDKFIHEHPEYINLVDVKHPGIWVADTSS